MVMRRQAEAVVVGQDGLRGVLEAGSQSGAPGDGGGAAERWIVRLDDGRRVSVPRELLIPQPDGSYTLRLSLADVTGAQGQPQAGQGRAATLAADRTTVIPIVEERVRVGKESVEAGRVQVRVTPREEVQVVDVPLTEERVEVERVPVNRVVEAPAGIREEGDVTIIPVYEEVLVVEKRLVLKEEVRLTRRRTTTNKQERVKLRKAEVTVLRPGAAGGPEKETHAETNR